MTNRKLDPDYLFRSLPREDFEKLELITEQEIQEALDRGRPTDWTCPMPVFLGHFYF